MPGRSAPEIAVLVRMNAQLAPIEAALTRAGSATGFAGSASTGGPSSRPRSPLARPNRGCDGRALATEIRALWAKELGHEGRRAGGSRGDEARERAAALETLLAIIDDVVDSGPHDRSRRARRGARQAGLPPSGTATADGVELVTYHRAKGLEWDAVFLPMLEEGSLPIRQALDDDAALEEERRLLYVGITRARVHLALSWAEQRESRGRESRRRPSRFLDGLVPRQGGGAVSARGPRTTQLPDGFAPPTPRADEPPLLGALRTWRSERARSDGVPAYVVAWDATLAAIADARPATLAGLRRVKGMGPAKLERYGDQILEVIHTSS